MNFESKPWHYPLTLRITTNKLCSVCPANGEWLINPTLDLPASELCTVAGIITLAAHAIEETFTSFAPRYNVGNCEPSLPDLKSHIRAMYALGAKAEFDLSADKVATFDKPKMIVKLPNNPQPVTGELVADRDIVNFASIRLDFPGVSYYISRAMERNVKPVLLNLMVKNILTGKTQYWDFWNQSWNDTYSREYLVHTVIAADLSNEAQRNKLTVRELVMAVSSNVVNSNYLPSKFPVENVGDVLIAADKGKLIQFAGINEKVLDLEVPVSDSLTIGVNCDHRDVEFDEYQFSWFAVPVHPVSDIKLNDPRGLTSVQLV